ncbi:hypothetical protein CSUI_009984 [Cystoisospora suis]|uniref:Uncharacterized protein n=1 Tax=Cystoisospora suis TaxID=483139 RepID=A0A2C6KI63_9APIC|nr:hypothetical protein CSUI_009984 [Cystoisospora suis]
MARAGEGKEPTCFNQRVRKAGLMCDASEISQGCTNSRNITPEEDTERWKRRDCAAVAPSADAKETATRTDDLRVTCHVRLRRLDDLNQITRLQGPNTEIGPKGQ